MELNLSKFQNLTNTTKTTLALTGTALTTIALYKLYEKYSYNQKEQQAFCSEKNDIYDRYKDMGSQFEGLLGVFSNDPDEKIKQKRLQS